MNTSLLSISHSVYLAVIIILGTFVSCDTKSRSRQYSHYEVAGTSKLTVFIDSVVADRRIVDNSLYMELMTKKDTFLVKPINQKLVFPKLEDSLTKVRIYYNDWYCEIMGQPLKYEYSALYFPEENVTIFIDTYPFEHPMAKKWLKQRKDQIYYEIRLQKESRYFLTSMAQDRKNQ